MAAPSFIAKGTVSATTAADVTPSYPGGIQAGDILFLLCVSKGNGTTTPSGWTLVLGGSFSDNAPTLVGQGELYWKRATGSEAGGVSVPRTGEIAGLEFTIAQIYLYRGTVPVIGNTNVKQDGNGNATITWDNLFFSGNERTAIAFVGQLTDSTPDTPAGYVESATDAVNSGPVSACLEANTKQNATSPAGATASGGYSGGWISFHTYIFNPTGRSFIVN